MESNGRLPDVKPKPPEWALKAGLPPPTETETLHEYCDRLGVDYEALTDELVPRTLENVHIRFVSELARSCPDVWQNHLAVLAERYPPPVRKRPRPAPFRY